MTKGKSSIFVRLLWAVVAAALTFVVLQVTVPELELPFIIGAVVAAAAAGALIGPFALELLTLT